jgi:hypothetical protein
VVTANGRVGAGPVAGLRVHLDGELVAGYQGSQVSARMT